MATLAKGIKLSEFASIPEEEVQRRVNWLVQSSVSPTQGQIEEQKNQLDDEIRYYESHYSMNSDEMRSRLRSGEIKETAEICSWLMLLKIRGRFDSKFGSSWPQSPEVIP